MILWHFCHVFAEGIPGGMPCEHKISLGGEKMAPSVLVIGGAIHFYRGTPRC